MVGATNEVHSRGELRRYRGDTRRKTAADSVGRWARASAAALGTEAEGAMTMQLQRRDGLLLLMIMVLPMVTGTCQKLVLRHNRSLNGHKGP